MEILLLKEVNISIFRPMLCASNNPMTYPKYFEELTFPKFASPKYDGIRAIVKNGVLMSRTFKPIPSLQCQEEFRMVDHIDGELLEGNVFDFGVYNRTQSHVMSEDKPGNISYVLFDYTHPDYINDPFYIRLDRLKEAIKDYDVYQLAPQEEVGTIDELLQCEEKWLELGAEGLILKCPISPYKQGRSTWRENAGIKLKREMQDEGIIIGYEERMINENEKKTNALGYSERSHHKDNKVPAGMIGKFLVDFNDEVISVAPGVFTHNELEEMYVNWYKYQGQILTFQHFPHGKKDAPRQARAKGIRHRSDM